MIHLMLNAFEDYEGEYQHVYDHVVGSWFVFANPHDPNDVNQITGAPHEACLRSTYPVLWGVLVNAGLKVPKSVTYKRHHVKRPMRVGDVAYLAKKPPQSAQYDPKSTRLKMHDFDWFKIERLK